ncbi:MAG: NapC/NirT family cytochrome c [Gammaproteobacteria bacterium]|nr:NapC/NirT family cytochrome c [Gammaproteobacteria bacterium]MCG3146331.1 Cytochrome c-type protein NapC [Gammaproteobacteria bacterium]
MRRLCRYIAANRGPFLLGAVFAVALVILVGGGEAAISTTAFCTSCHEMTYPAQELKKSTHYAALGADPECKDCHVPQGIANFHRAVATHLFDGARELWLHFTRDYSDIKKFNKLRLEMAHHARMNLKRWDSVTCRDCHRNARPPGASARAAHAKMETQGATCIDCHQNLVHKEVDETDLDKSLAEGKMVVRETM